MIVWRVKLVGVPRIEQPDTILRRQGDFQSVDVAMDNASFIIMWLGGQTKRRRVILRAVEESAARRSTGIARRRP